MQRITVVEIAADVLVLVCAVAGVIYGLLVFFKKKALFPKLATCAVGCLALGKLAAVVSLLTAGGLPDGFHVTYLGYFGCFLFFLSANFGYMETMADNENPEWRKYRLRAITAPLIMLLMVIALLLSPSGTEKKLSCAVSLLSGIPAVYYMLKHILIPDVEDGIFASIRRYNACTLGLSLLIALAFVFEINGLAGLNAAANALTAANMLLLLPVLRKGVEKWTA